MKITALDVFKFARAAAPEIRQLLSLFNGDPKKAIEHLREGIEAKRVANDEALKAKYDTAE